MPATNIEQMLLEMINRARLDPAAEAALYGIDLNEGLAAGTISPDTKQPLAMNETLLSVARGHTQDMLARQYFAHNTPEGVTPFQRMTSAGYNYSIAGENIAWSGTTGSVSTAMRLSLHQNLFVDSGVSGRGHRRNILNANFQEIGVGEGTGTYSGFNATMLTEDFGTTGSQQFLTGVSYTDSDHDNFYSIGEGRGSVSVSISGGTSTTTGSAGGYSAQIGSGVKTVTFSGGGLVTPMVVSVTITAGTNAKVDAVDQGIVRTSASLSAVSGVTNIIGLGTFGLALSGAGGNESIFGTKGGDTLGGNGGDDTFTGGGGTDTINGGSGFDRTIFNFTRAAATTLSQNTSTLAWTISGRDRARRSPTSKWRNSATARRWRCGNGRAAISTATTARTFCGATMRTALPVGGR